MDARPEGGEKPVTHTKSVSPALNYLIWLGNITAFTPFVVFEDISGSYALKSTVFNIIFSNILVCAVHAFSTISAVYLYVGYTVLTPFMINFLYARVIIGFLTHIKYEFFTATKSFSVFKIECLLKFIVFFTVFFGKG